MTAVIKRPMLAVACEDLNKVRYPMAATFKLDGIRAFTDREKIGLTTQLLSRSRKPIKNDYTRTTLEAVLPAGVDGEIMAGSTFQEVTSGVMTKEMKPEFTYFAFDYVKDDPNKPYIERVEDLVEWYGTLNEESKNFIKILVPEIVNNAEELKAFEEKALALGHEGVIIRDLKAPYKNGRSTLSEQGMLKIKRFSDAEAKIIGFVELMSNQNEAKVNALGLTERSSHKENKVPAGVLGKFIVEDLETGITFGVGAGFTMAQRKDFWERKDELKGELVKYKFFEKGVKLAPRHPVFLSLRDRSDL